jgi:hypothetical protein
MVSASAKEEVANEQEWKICRGSPKIQAENLLVLLKRWKVRMELENYSHWGQNTLLRWTWNMCMSAGMRCESMIRKDKVQTFKRSWLASITIQIVDKWAWWTSLTWKNRCHVATTEFEHPSRGCQERDHGLHNTYRGLCQCNHREAIISKLRWRLWPGYIKSLKLILSLI